MKVELRCLLILILLAKISYCSQDPLVGRDNIIDLADGVGGSAFKAISSSISNEPYNPGSFAWGWQYHARGCLIMYNLTGERKWLDWAMDLTDHFVAYSDVNGDGVPAWGNYNESWGNPRYDFREYTVWDGVIGLPIIEAAKVIRSVENLSSNASLSAKANAYVELIERIIRRHHKSWTQVEADQGYYWDDPNEDVGPIVNRFTALGRVELILGDVTGNVSYYEKPRQMANYMIANMKHNQAEDLYTWTYWYGEDRSEDISHGAIELEFLIMANQRGLLDEVHLQRIANTYLGRIWQVPELLEGKRILAWLVDGSDDPRFDYARISRGWILLAPYEPVIYEHQRTVFGILHERSGIYASSVSLLGLAQIPLMANELKSQGIDPDQLRAVDLDLLVNMLDQARNRLNQTRALGAQAKAVTSNLDEAEGYVNEDSLVNASIPIALILKAWEMLARIIETGEMLGDLSDQIDEAEELGIHVSDLRVNLSGLRTNFAVAETESFLKDIDTRIGNVTVEVKRAVAETLIEIADEVVSEAKKQGIDTRRHKIFLMKAHESYEGGFYDAARHWTGYPLKLKEELSETGLVQVVVALGCSILMGRGKFIFIADTFEKGRC